MDPEHEQTMAMMDDFVAQTKHTLDFAQSQYDRAVATRNEMKDLLEELSRLEEGGLDE